MKNLRLIIAVFMIMLFQFVLFYAVLTKITYQDKVISNLNSKISQVDKSIITKADQSKIEVILKQIEAIELKVKTINERVNGWQGIWDNFFEPHQKQYMKRKQKNE